MLGSILSIGACVFAWGVLWVTSNFGLAAVFPARFDDAGLTSDPTMLIAFIAVSGALSVGAGWLCATLVKTAFMKHVTILAFIQLAIGIFVQSSVWELMPMWYHVIFLSLVVPMHLLGGKIRVQGATD